MFDYEYEYNKHAHYNNNKHVIRPLHLRLTSPSLPIPLPQTHQNKIPHKPQTSIKSPLMLPLQQNPQQPSIPQMLTSILPILHQQLPLTIKPKR